MLAERLSGIGLKTEMEEDDQTRFRESIILKTKKLGDQDTEASEVDYDYKQKIGLFIEMEKLKLVS